MDTSLDQLLRENPTAQVEVIQSYTARKAMSLI